MYIFNDYWNDFMDQKINSKPLDKVEIELSAGIWTDITSYYIGGANFEQEKERAPDKISAGDVRFSFVNHDNKFTPTDTSSIFYNVDFQNKKIKFSEGFYDLGYLTQAIMYIKDVAWDYDEQICYLHCQDIMQRLIDENLNIFPVALIPIPNTANTGNGTCSEIATLPFATVSENWTLTCTLGGADGVATFSVVGSVSGNIGTATSGTEFPPIPTSTDPIKFTISAGVTPWIIGDIFTFSTYLYPQWTTTNPAKIIWSILTGYDYDSAVQQNWSSRVFSLDNTKSDDNIDINYNTFVEAITNIDNNLTGYIPYDKNAAECLEEIIIHFLGSLYTDNKGRISLSSYKPSFGASLLFREFSDTKKIFALNTEQDTAQIINKTTIKCKRSASWAWSNVDEVLDDIYSNSNSTSISKYGLRNPFDWDDNFWYSPSRASQEWFADRIIDKFSNPPNEIEFETGLDGIRQNLADKILFTDSRTNNSQKLMEVISISKDFEAKPKTMTLTVSETGTIGLNWCFLGSGENEEDGLSPQNSNWDSASASDRQFCYLSTTGATSDPRYYLFLFPFLCILNLFSGGIL